MTDRNGACFAFDNLVLRQGTFQTNTGSFSSVPSINALATIQVPVPYVVVTPDDGEIDFQWDYDSFDCDVIALLSHTLPANAVVRFLIDNVEVFNKTASLIANRNRARNEFCVLSETETGESLRVNIQSAGSNPVLLSGLWVSEAIFFDANKSAPFDGIDTSIISEVSLTKWINKKTIGDILRVEAEGVRDDKAWGVNGDINFKGAFELIGNSDPLIYIRRCSNQTNIDLTATYGTLSRVGSVRQTSADINHISFDFQEMR